MNPNDTYRDEDWLRREYTDNERDVQEIADEVGVNQSTVYKWLGNHGIATVKQGGPVNDANIEMLRDETWLRTQYAENDRSVDDIAREVGVLQVVVDNWLEKHRIKTRS